MSANVDFDEQGAQRSEYGIRRPFEDKTHRPNQKKQPNKTKETSNKERRKSWIFFQENFLNINSSGSITSRNFGFAFATTWRIPCEGTSLAIVALQSARVNKRIGRLQKQIEQTANWKQKRTKTKKQFPRVRKYKETIPEPKKKHTSRQDQRRMGKNPQWADREGRIYNDEV